MFIACFKLWILSLIIFPFYFIDTLRAEDNLNNDLIELLSSNECRFCDLKNADLVHADLRSADLYGSNLTGANLNNANLDNANLDNVNLTDVNLNSSSLRNTSFQGAIIMRTDLRESDLSGASLEEYSLVNAFWRDSQGVDFDSLSYAELHNAGSEYLNDKIYQKAEYFFQLASDKNPVESNSILALIYTQLEIGNLVSAKENLRKAELIYAEKNNIPVLVQINNLQNILEKRPNKPAPGNGLGVKLFDAAITSLSLFGRPIFNIPNTFSISR